MSMEDGTLRKLELYLHDLHKKIESPSYLGKIHHGL